jgi:hypothetical protein
MAKRRPQQPPPVRPALRRRRRLLRLLRGAATATAAATARQPAVAPKKVLIGLQMQLQQLDGKFDEIGVRGLTPGARAGAMYALELDLNDPGSPIAREISWRTSSEYCTDGIYRRVSYVDAAPRRLQQ